MYCRMADMVKCPPELINMIKDAMKDELHDHMKYKMMMEMTDDSEVKRQINFASEDEAKHYKMFKQLLFALTGRVIDVPKPQVEHYDNLLDAIKTSIDGELEAVELYRKIKAQLPTMAMRDMLYEIITDEQEHATRFVYLYAKEK
ncbi:MAG: ferritin-like domain-containing protein [Clostridiales bacterium]|nr:ferritin-like domain-containing protein [Clostridiales bacterium]HBM80244.1 rubrerythrin [Clostridiaceae bacterium]